MVTSAMLRTCAVRLLAIKLTLSVRSFHAADIADLRLPPSLPSVPTSRATRVTSAVNTPSCWIMVLTMVASAETRPQWSSVHIQAHGLRQVPLRHSRNGAGHFGGWPEQVLHERVDRDFHLTPGPLRLVKARALAGFPSLPTTCPTRRSSCAICWLAQRSY